jgi:RNA polymerase sigma-70 factor (ECF subfamily)
MQGRASHQLEAFLGQVPAARRAQPSARLAQALTEALTQARRAWPGVELRPAAFLAHLAARAAPDADLHDWLTRVHAGDLYLTCACLEGAPSALEILDSEYVRKIAGSVATRARQPELADELREALLSRLLVASSKASPRLGAYLGRGPLAAWLRVAAVRALTDLRRAVPSAAAHQDAAGEVQANLTEPELAVLRSRHGPELANAIQVSIAALPRRERTLLRLHYFENMSTYAMGRLYGVHSTTVVRWLATARELILKKTRQLLRNRLKVSEAELDGILALADSQLNVTLSRFLNTTG